MKLDLPILKAYMNKVTYCLLTVVLFSGCVSRSRYNTLLNRCVEANVSLVNQLEEYETAVDKNNRAMRTLCESNHRPVKQALCDDICDIPEVKVEQEKK